MNQEKLNEASAEARRSTAETMTTYGTQHSIDVAVALTGMSLSYDEVAESAFQKGAQWHESLPLSERLTEDEKKDMRWLYEEAELLQMSPGTSNNGYRINLVLSSLLGDDFFKTTEQ